MSGAQYPKDRTWGSDEDVTGTKLNSYNDNERDNLNPAGVAGDSDTLALFQTTEDPGELGTEVLPISLRNEVRQLRQIIKEITGKSQHYESPSTSLEELGSSLSGASSRLVSGRIVSTATQFPAFLVADGVGNGLNVTLKAAVTDFVYFVDGTENTLTSDKVLLVAAAPSTNNTALVDDGDLSGQEDSKFVGSAGRAPTIASSVKDTITIDTVGSEITSLIGGWAAFKHSSGYFIAFVESATELKHAQRAFFLDESDVGFDYQTMTNNDTLTLMKLAWIFIKSDGTLRVTYNDPFVQASTPTGVTGDYWFDTANSTWKTHDGSSFVSADASFAGHTFTDATDCVASRSSYFSKSFLELNSVRLIKRSDSTAAIEDSDSRISVNGTTYNYNRSAVEWSMVSDLDSGVSEAANTKYYFYITAEGDRKISDIKPLDISHPLGGLYHPFKMWRCTAEINNDGSSNLDAATIFQEYQLLEVIIKTEMLEDLLVTNAKLAVDAVTNAKILDGTIQGIKRNYPGSSVNAALDGVMISASSGAFSTAAGPVVVVGGDLDTHGRPVLVLITSDNGTSAAEIGGTGLTSAGIYIRRDNVAVARWDAKLTAGAFDSIGFSFIDTPPAGTNVDYDIFAEAAGGTLFVNNVKIVAIEL